MSNKAAVAAEGEIQMTECLLHTLMTGRKGRAPLDPYIAATHLEPGVMA